MLMTSSLCLRQQKGCRGSLTHRKFSVIKGNSVSILKTKVVMLRSKAACQPFIFNSSELERVESYKYLGFEFHAIKNLALGVLQLVSSAKKAMHSMNRRCAL